MPAVSWSYDVSIAHRSPRSLRRWSSRPLSRLGAGALSWVMAVEPPFILESPFGVPGTTIVSRISESRVSRTGRGGLGVGFAPAVCDGQSSITAEVAHRNLRPRRILPTFVLCLVDESDHL